jgi:hypothetical protein
MILSPPKKRELPMRIAIITAIALVALVLLAAIASNKIAPAAPVEGWKSVATRSFAFAPGENSRWDLPTHGRTRVSVAADVPVNFKVDVGGCSASRVTSATEECTLRKVPQPTLLISDARDAQVSAMTALAGTWAKSSNVVEGSIKRSRVTVELYEWTCTANCPPASSR